ncbi:DUF3168 domain-containing protein [Streptomyces apocyni]|uniref:DUF3168 domain-containing protein n=1 Tax=Streptomyces apocyni TaxID=2654677 RepID=UPI0012E9A291|nr:DUF3168 domain-containing protein [Streptomyces apocyni]
MTAEPAHEVDVVDVVTVRRDGSVPAAATTLVRLLGLLPPHWSCDPEIDQDRIRLRITLTQTTDRRTVCRAVRAALADPALRGWSLSDGSLDGRRAPDRSDRSDPAPFTRQQSGLGSVGRAQSL